jgi:hemerythrin superfamily protein
MKATTFLEKQHRKVEALFTKLESGRADKATVLEELSTDVAAHMVIEHELFYPAVMKLNEDLICESFEEHAMAELALKRLRATKPEDVSFRARMRVAKEIIEQHVDEEEEDLFPVVEDAMEEDELEDLGAKLKSRYDDIAKLGFDKIVPPTYEKTSSDIALEHLPSEAEEEQAIVRRVLRGGKRPRVGA